jgi:hypothetical protein
VLYKKELRWAKPCMKFGSFEVPDKQWIQRNYFRYKVWVTYEEERVGMAKQDGLIWVGFLPIGDENYPEPATDIDENYPEVLVTEKGKWRFVTDSRDGQEFVQVYKIISEVTGDDPYEGADETNLAAILDGTATISAADGAVTLYIPQPLGDYAASTGSATVSLNAKTEGEGSFQVILPNGMAIIMSEAGDGSIMIKNAAGDQYVEVNDNAINLNGQVQVTGGGVIGDAILAQPAVLGTFLQTALNTYATTITAAASALNAAAQVYFAIPVPTPPQQVTFQTAWAAWNTAVAAAQAALAAALIPALSLNIKVGP